MYKLLHNVRAYIFLFLRLYICLGLSSRGAGDMTTQVYFEHVDVYVIWYWITEYVMV